MCGREQGSRFKHVGGVEPELYRRQSLVMIVTAEVKGLLCLGRQAGSTFGVFRVPYSKLRR